MASEVFRGQKDSYPPSVAALFLGTRLGERSARTHARMPARTHAHTQLTLGKLALFLSLFPESEQINLKVVQTLGSEKVQVNYPEYQMSM